MDKSDQTILDFMRSLAGEPVIVRMKDATIKGTLNAVGSGMMLILSGDEGIVVSYRGDAFSWIKADKDAAR